MHDALSMLSPSTVPYMAQPGFARTYEADRLTLGLAFPIESFPGEVPTMQGQKALAQFAEEAGFAALWVRDVPLRDPGFGDVGQIFDPFVYLGYMAGQTTTIALGTSSVVVPLRSPLHLAKAATSIDQLSGGRLLLGVATGDRAVEFPAFDVDAENRAAIFREYIHVLREAQKTSYQPLHWSGGSLRGADMIPKPVAEEIPLLITGSSRQTLGWNAANGHGWITYPRPLEQQRIVIEGWRAAVQENAGDVFKPFTQSLYVDLDDRPDAPLQPIHLGYRLGRNTLIILLERLQDMGANHVIINLRFGRRPARDVLAELGEHLVPRFPAHNTVPPAMVLV